MKPRQNENGYTLTEIMTTMVIFGLVTTCAIAMFLTSVKVYDRTTTQAYTDTDAVIAMQRMVLDVREAKSVAILDNGARLQIIFPIKTQNGAYDRHFSDDAHPVEYYLSDSTGALGRTGTWLWRNNSDTREPIKRDVESLLFEQDTARSVKITVITLNNTAEGPQRTELTQRVVYLRNY